MTSSINILTQDDKKYILENCKQKCINTMESEINKSYRAIYWFLKRYNLKARSYYCIGDELTPREREVLPLLLLRKKEIAKRLTISYPTVSTHSRVIMEKLQVNTKEKAVFKALKDGLLKIEEIQLNAS